MVNHTDLCVRRTESFRGSNTGTTTAYFSVKRRKWIRPRAKWDAQTIFYYYLYPGKYVKVSVSYWNKRDPPYKVTASLVRLVPYKISGKPSDLAEAIIYITRWHTGETCEEEVIAQARYEVSNYDEVPNEILQDAILAVPSYHGCPSYDFSKQYPEEVVNDLMNRIMRGEEFIARIEYE